MWPRGPLPPPPHGRLMGPACPAARRETAAGPRQVHACHTCAARPLGVEATARLTHRHDSASRGASLGTVSPKPGQCPLLPIPDSPVSRSSLQAEQAADAAWGIGTGDGTGQGPSARPPRLLRPGGALPDGRCGCALDCTPRGGRGVLCRGHRGPVNRPEEGLRQDRVPAPAAPLGEAGEAGAGPVVEGAREPRDREAAWTVGGLRSTAEASPDGPLCSESRGPLHSRRVSLLSRQWT